MKIMMRPDKSQQVTVLKYTTPGYYEYRKMLHLLTGFTTYEALLVGGAGGQSGQALGNASSRQYQCGGGGGGVLRLSGPIADLPSISALVVGGPGANGADSLSNEAKAGNGEDGGDTLFNAHMAYGGGGAIGGQYAISGSGGTLSRQYPTNSEGGDGGGNSAALGTGGAGGRAARLEQEPGTAEVINSTAPTMGTYVVGGVAPVIGGGVGGGGGPGDCLEVINVGQSTGQARAGGAGNHPDLSSAAGNSGSTSGGSGGGANVQTITGVAEEYGTSKPSGGNPNGVLYIEFS